MSEANTLSKSDPSYKAFLKSIAEKQLPTLDPPLVPTPDSGFTFSVSVKQNACPMLSEFGSHPHDSFCIRANGEIVRTTGVTSRLLKKKFKKQSISSLARKNLEFSSTNRDYSGRLISNTKPGGEICVTKKIKKLPKTHSKTPLTQTAGAKKELAQEKFNKLLHTTCLRSTNKRKTTGMMAGKLMQDWWFGRHSEQLIKARYTKIVIPFFQVVCGVQEFRMRKDMLIMPSIVPARTDKLIKLKIFRMIWRNIRDDQVALEKCFKSEPFRNLLSTVKFEDVNHCFMKRCLKSPEFRDLFSVELESEEFRSKVMLGSSEFTKVFRFFSKITRNSKKFDKLKSILPLMFPPSPHELMISKSIMFNKY